MNVVFHAIGVLLLTQFGCGDRQRYDGWFNNLANPQWGGVGEDILFNLPVAYSDLTYLPAGDDRPNAREVSNDILAGPSGLPSYDNRTALFAFFGQMVAYEMVHAATSTCPVELIKIPVPNTDQQFYVNDSSQRYLPFVRSNYNKQSGLSPNSPRRPINKISSWIDGTFIYGHSQAWCNSMRTFKDGRLATLEGRNYPALNEIRLPLNSFPNPVTNELPQLETMWMFGDPHSHQNPGLAAMAVVWFRYHNYMAAKKRQHYPDWPDEKIFQAARKHVIGVFQNIVYHEWLPLLLSEALPPYDGYKSHVHPGVTAIFEAAAFRLGLTHVPPGIYVRDHRCNFHKDDHGLGVRLCNSYWRSQDMLSSYDVEGLVLGMASQIQEREDHIIVDDLRGKSYGPLHFTRHDLAVTTIMRGRDHGLPDYNTARAAYGLPPARQWQDINPSLYQQDQRLFQRLSAKYKDISKLDVYPAAMLESTPSGPGELFKAVLLDQFTRIRDGDRFWFENPDSELFTMAEIGEIRNTTLKDVIVMATDIGDEDIQDNVFVWLDGNPCPQPKQLEISDMEECTPHRGYDYVVGSDVAYVASFTCLAAVPLVSILIAYIIGQYKKWRGKEGQLFKKKADHRRIKARFPGQHYGLEWKGQGIKPQQVLLTVVSHTMSIKVTTVGQTVLRNIKLTKQPPIQFWLAKDGRQDFLTVHVPKEIDLVMQFPSEIDRREFLNNVMQVTPSDGRQYVFFEHPTKYVQEQALTKAKREDQITKFFRSVFTQADTMEGVDSADDVDNSHGKDVVDCELSREEFAEALALKPNSMFVDQMFTLIDRDGNGFISFKELLYAVVLFAKGTREDKLKLLFKMYDTDRNGTLSRDEVAEMVGSMMEMANTYHSAEEVKQMVSDMFVAAGQPSGQIMRFDDFTRVMSMQMEDFWNSCSTWKDEATQLVVDTPAADGDQTAKGPRKRGTANAVGSATNGNSFTSVTLDSSERHVTKAGLFFEECGQCLENNRQQIVAVFIFFAICALVFCERTYFYAIEQEHRGLRTLAGYGVSITRGAAAGMSFTFCLLLLTMCRNIITKLRETFLNLYIPFDSSVAFHKLVAWTALFFTMLHIIGYCFNFYHVATQPVSFLCVFDEIYWRADFLPRIPWWFFQTLAGFTGVLLVVVIAILYVFATQTARRFIFSAFWTTHKLFYVIYILTLLHGCTRLVQRPYFPFYFIPPAILFLLDKMISVSRKKKEMALIRAELLPSDVTMLEFKRPADFDYRSGQWVRLSCSALGGDEYHSLTLTSAPNEECLSVFIRAVGPWTWNIRKVYDPDNLSQDDYPKLYVDGPFGAGQQDWFRYEVSVCVGGGIGVTPYASILKDFVFMMSAKSTFKLKCKKLYFIWVTASHKHFEWLIDILKQVEDVDDKGVVEVLIFITNVVRQFDLRTTMMYICEEHFQRLSGRSMFTGLKGLAHFGRPDIASVLTDVHNEHPSVRKIGVFSCGPTGLTKSVQQACQTSSKSGKTRFEHHFENF